jgi:hypothetical protein
VRTKRSWSHESEQGWRVQPRIEAHELAREPLTQRPFECTERSDIGDQATEPRIGTFNIALHTRGQDEQHCHHALSGDHELLRNIVDDVREDRQHGGTTKDGVEARQVDRSISAKQISFDACAQAIHCFAILALAAFQADQAIEEPRQTCIGQADAISRLPRFHGHTRPKFSIATQPRAQPPPI